MVADVAGEITGIRERIELFPIHHNLTKNERELLVMLLRLTDIVKTIDERTSGDGK